MYLGTTPLRLRYIYDDSVRPINVWCQPVCTEESCIWWVRTDMTTPLSLYEDVCIGRGANIRASNICD